MTNHQQDHHINLIISILHVLEASLLNHTRQHNVLIVEKDKLTELSEITEAFRVAVLEIEL